MGRYFWYLEGSSSGFAVIYAITMDGTSYSMAERRGVLRVFTRVRSMRMARIVGLGEVGLGDRPLLQFGETYHRSTE